MWCVDDKVRAEIGWNAWRWIHPRPQSHTQSTPHHITPSHHPRYHYYSRSKRVRSREKKRD